MKQKKIIAIAIAVTMILAAALTGCGGKAESGDTATTGAATASGTGNAGGGEPVELTWFTTMNKKMVDEDIVFEKLNEYLKEKLNVTVKQNIMITTDYMAKIPVILASGQAYDICFSAGWVAEYLPNVAKGAFEPLNDLLDKYAPETKKHIPQILWDGVSVKGKIYGIPAYKEIGHQFGLFLNKTLSDKLGVDISGVKKWTDVEPVLKQIKEKDANVIPFAVGTNIADMVLPREHVTGDWELPGVVDVPWLKSYNRADGKVFNQYETPEFKALCETMFKWGKAGYLQKDPINYKTSKDDVTAGKLFATYLWYAPNYEKIYSEQVGQEIVWVPMFEPIYESSDSLGGLQTISANSKHKKEAMQFLNLVNTDLKVGNLLRHGIEGKHYLIKDEQVDKSAISGIDVKNHPYDYSLGWQFGSVFNQTWNKPYPKDIADIFANYNKGAKASANVGFSFDNSNSLNEIAAIKNVIKEFNDPLVTGMVDPGSTLPRFIEKLKANNVDKLIAEVQKQLDEFNAAKGK